MKKTIVMFLLMSILLSFVVLAEDVVIYREIPLDNGYKIVYTWQEVIPAMRQPVTVYDKCGVIDEQGNFVVEPIYNQISPPVEGRAMFSYNNNMGYFGDGKKRGYFDENWEIVIEPIYDSAADFSEGRAAVGKSGVGNGFIDINGNEVVPLIYSDVDSFKNGVAKVRISEDGYYFYTFLREGTIDLNGNVIEPVIFRHEDEYQILLSENMVEMGGKCYKNSDFEYPFINYLGYAYIPLTYFGCRAMGITCDWTRETGLILSSGTEFTEPLMGENGMKRGIYDKATLYKGKITINGTEYDCGDAYYPILSYKDVVYLPVLWKQGMEALGLNYTYKRDDTYLSNMGCMVFKKN